MVANGYLKKNKGNTAQLLCARCAVRNFVRLPKFDTGLLAQGKENLGNMTEFMQADCVQSRQAVVVRCCPR